MPDPHDLLAAELAFGLLDGNERSAAERLRATNDTFAAEVAKWDDIAETWLGELPDHPPSPQLWSRVAALLGPSAAGEDDGHRTTASAPAGPGLWRPLALAASLLACLFAGLWLSHPPLAPHSAQVAVGRYSVAQIGAAGEPHLAAVLYDRDSGTLTIRIQAIGDDPAKVPEIWLINGTNPPHSLGFAQSGAAVRMQASARLQRSFVGGATLAITLEPVSDHPHAAPSSKILGTGTISTL